MLNLMLLVLASLLSIRHKNISIGYLRDWMKKNIYIVNADSQGIGDFGNKSYKKIIYTATILIYIDKFEIYLRFIRNRKVKLLLKIERYIQAGEFNRALSLFNEEGNILINDPIYGACKYRLCFSLIQSGETELLGSILSNLSADEILENGTLRELYVKYLYWQQKITELEHAIEKINVSKFFDEDCKDKSANLELYKKIISNNFEVGEDFYLRLSIFNNERNCNNLIFYLYINKKLELIKNILNYAKYFKTKSIVEFYLNLLIEYDKYVPKLKIKQKTPKEKFIITIPVWGQEYFNLLVNYSLPALFAEKNINSFLDNYDVEVLISTDLETKSKILSTKVFEIYSKKCEFVIHTIPKVLYSDNFRKIAGNKIAIMSFAHRCAIKYAKLNGAGLIFLAPDMILCENYLDEIKA